MQKKKRGDVRKLEIAVILAAIVGLTACGGQSGMSQQNASVPQTSSSSTSGTAQSVSITVSPGSALVLENQSATFTQAVTGSSNTAVNWSVQEGSAGGTVDQAGNYTAPGVAGTFHVVATSQADTSKSAVATITVAGAARLTAPPNGTTGLDATQPVSISWAPIPNASWYQLWLGSSRGANDLYNGSQQTSTTLTLTLQSGRTYYARLFTGVGSASSYSDSTFATATGIAHLQSPVNGATDVSQFQQFTWNSVSDAVVYVLLVSPTGFDTWDMYYDDMASFVSARYVWGLLPNTYYYVTLCTVTSTDTTCAHSTFTTGPSGPLPDRQNFYAAVQSLTEQVRLMTQGMGGISTPGTPLYQEALVQRQNPNGVTCLTYGFTLLNELTQNQILGRRRDITLNGIDVHFIAEYWDPFNSKWEVADPTFGLVYFDPNSQVGQSAEELNSLLLSGNLTAINPLWVTNNGPTYMNNYSIDPIELYNNVLPIRSLESLTNYVPNSPLPFMNPVPLNTAQGQHGAYVFQFAKPTDQITINNSAQAVTITPQNIYGWSSDIALRSGWCVTSSVPDGMQIYTHKRILF